MLAGTRLLLLKIVALAAPFVTVVAGLEWRLGQVETSYSRKKAAIERNLSTVQVIVTGSSHELASISPRFIRRPAVNLANVSQSLRYDRLIVSKYLDRMTALRLALLGLSYFSMDYSIEQSPERWRVFFYSRVFGFAPEDPELQHDPRMFSWFALYGNTESFRRLATGFSSNHEESAVDELGWLPMEPGNADDLEVQRRVLFHEWLRRPENLRPNVEHLRTLLHSLRSRGVTSVLFTSPLSPIYRRHMLPQQYTFTQELVAAVAHEEGVEYVNYTADSRFTQEDFVDADHLGPVGAEKLTRIVDAEIVSRLLH